MPLYQFQCKICKAIAEEFRSLNEDSTYASDPCYVCLEPMPKILSPVVGYVKGTTNPLKYK